LGFIAHEIDAKLNHTTIELPAYSYGQPEYKK